MQRAGATLEEMDESTNLTVSLLAGTVGLALFVYGKKQVRVPQMLVGLGLMVLPYFMPNAYYAGGVAGALILALIVSVRLGW